MKTLLLAFLLAAPAAAQDAPQPPKRWKDAAEASLVTTNGNTKTTTYSLKNLFTFSFNPRTTLEMDGGALHSKNQGEVTAENFYGSEKLGFKFSDRDYVFEKYRWDRNVFTGLRHRHEATLGAGREFWKTERDLLLAEGGPGYVVEERLGERRRSFAASRVFAKYTHEFNAAVKFLQTVEQVQSLKDHRDYRLNTETGLVAAITSVFSVKTSYLWRHVGQPPPNNVKDDTTTSVALIANF